MVLVVLLIMPFCMPVYRRPGVVTSANVTLVDADPLVFAHYTDPHLSSWDTSRESNLSAFGDEVFGHRVAVLLGTGDYQDGFHSSGLVSSAYQMEGGMGYLLAFLAARDFSQPDGDRCVPEPRRVWCGRLGRG
jgi:hypothetical protein